MAKHNDPTGITGEEWSQSVLDAVKRVGCDVTSDCKVYDSTGDMMFGAGGEYFIGVTGNDPDDAIDDPTRTVMVLHVRDLMAISMRVLSVLKTEGKVEYLQSLGIPIVDMSGGDDATEQTLQ